MIQRLSLHPAILEVRDLEAACRFFQETLALPTLLRNATSATLELHHAPDGQTSVLLLQLSAEQPDSRKLTLEVDRDDFPHVRYLLQAHGAHLMESHGSSAPGCAWQVLDCVLPDGHRLRVVSINPERCAPVISRGVKNAQ
ncbi:VOC family protein [Cobetia marina]|jgi:catechol 2,3-dioxygenase-like lactoylglutathione lyase family enzyme|uniref:VOC family protein n=1 Tax=Cobetia marina TaxID=28258 RepID=A0ABU9GC47_COBMA|nr:MULTISPECIES: VOC family protein [Cobetia]AOM01173.1 hypothetical protein BFX80_07475 [Cobetia marina]MDA5564308.1 VOC family protein [Cobetia sp. MMG027]MDH2290040.1 VOC family protein [Cobetia sp. 10Alg 146]MDI6004140.1 VOC family protein [Cobetia pacifica]MDN2656640.1 VOC family protein [Cobetia sp. 14N.309.X.WAT.E.A4]